jgi:hypothetical protein
MSSVQIATLFLAAVAAGAINSVAGGGSFISFPALLLAGVPPISANATAPADAGANLRAADSSSAAGHHAHLCSEAANHPMDTAVGRAGARAMVSPPRRARALLRRP